MCNNKILETKSSQTVSIKKLTKAEIGQLLSINSPDLATMIDRVNITNFESLFYKATYKYGATIIENGKVYLPLANGEAISFNDPNLPHEIGKDLGYDPKTGSPLGMILTKSCEFYTKSADGVVPCMMLYPGDMIGLARVLDNIANKKSHSSPFIWDLCAGARSISMLAKISDSACHNKLKKLYNIKAPCPESYQDHHAIFKELAQNTASNWCVEILFFSNEFLKQLATPAWAELHNYFLQMQRSSHKIWHNLPRWNAIFSHIERENRLGSVSPYVLDIAKHIFTVIVDSSPGYQPATDEEAAPISLLQTIYRDDYGLEHDPIIMHATQFSKTDGKAVYISLNYPIGVQSDPSTFKGKSKIILLDELRRIIGKYVGGILEMDDFNGMIDILYEKVAQTSLAYFHTAPGNYDMVKLDMLVSETDTRFSLNGAKSKFPHNSPFFKGCVQIKLIS